MIVAPYKKDQPVDDILLKVIEGIRYNLAVKNDDFFICLIGNTGTGKSSLTFHIMEAYLKDKSSVDYVSLNKSDWVGSLEQVAKQPLPRFCCYDEANVNKRDSLTKWNKEVIDLYLSIRGLQIFHVWNNPSIDMLDKSFIEERLKGCILIVTKDITRPRIYYYFTKRNLLKVLEKYGNLKLETLRRVRKKYAYYRGWFKPYNGELWQEYLAQKDDRMIEKVEELKARWGKADGMLSNREVRNKLKIGVASLRAYEHELMSKGEIKMGVDVVRHTNGFKYYTDECLVKFDELMHKKLENRHKAWFLPGNSGGKNVKKDKKSGV